MMGQQVGSQDAVTTRCVHYWRIAEPVPNERYSRGVCAYCGKERYWDNWAVEDRGYSWAERKACK